jgi:predicted nucleotidyltransferase component of viral defense system
VSTDANEIYLRLQRLARESGRGTQEVLELYVHERFLARLSQSRYREQFVLKGGLLLTVHGVRRATRDADLLARALSNEPAAMEAVVAEIAELDVRDDGVVFDTSSTRSQIIREEAEYGALRIKMDAGLSSARLRLQLDISVGDPVDPEPIDYAELLGGEFEILGYPLEQTLAEKIATMVVRGNANTRERDWADVYLLAERHEIPASGLGEALEATAKHRKHDLQPLREVIDTLPEARQAPWLAFRERAGVDPVTPESLADVVTAVMTFADPVLGGQRTGTWNPRSQAWETD